MRIGLLYAMKGEIESMLTEETPLLQEKAGVSFYRIREDIIACCGGVGKVNAAMATQLFIDLYHPDLMMNVGVAGSFEDLPIGTLVLLGLFFPKVGLAGDCLAIIMTFGTLSFLITTPETWVPDLGGPNHGFPYLSGAGRLVIKDIVIMAGAVTLLGTDIKRILKARLGCTTGEKSCCCRND